MLESTVSWGRAVLGSTVDTYFASVEEAYGRFSRNFFVVGQTLDPEVDSRRFSPREHARRLQSQWHAFYWFCLSWCTSRCVPDVCRQVGMLRFRSFTMNSGHYFHEPLVLCSIFSSRHVAPDDFLGALDDEEFFVVEGSGGGGVARSLDSQVTLTHCSVVVLCGHTHRSSKPASKTTITTTTTRTTKLRQVW